MSKRSGPAFFNSQSVPFRVVGVSGGASTFKPSEDWLNLFLAGALGFALIDSAFTRAGALDVDLTSGARQLNSATQGLVGLNLYIGRRVVSESSLRHSRSTIGFDLVISNVAGLVPVQGDLDFWEYAGSIRYNLAVESIQPFVKLGYGLSWYQLQEVTFAGNQLGEGASDWVRQPSLFDNLLPNTWHLGVGLEYIPIRSVGGADFGVKTDVALHTHNLGIERNSGTFSFVQDPRIYRWTLSLSGNLSF